MALTSKQLCQVYRYTERTELHRRASRASKGFCAAVINFAEELEILAPIHNAKEKKIKKKKNKKHASSSQFFYRATIDYNQTPRWLQRRRPPSAKVSNLLMTRNFTLTRSNVVI